MSDWSACRNGSAAVHGTLRACLRLDPFSLSVGQKTCPGMVADMSVVRLSTADIISAIEFDRDGMHLATGDRGGRVVLFERTPLAPVRDAGCLSQRSICCVNRTARPPAAASLSILVRVCSLPRLSFGRLRMPQMLLSALTM